MEEETNAQAEAQTKKDEAEVQVNEQHLMEATGAEIKESRRPGTLVQIVGLHATV